MDEKPKCETCKNWNRRDNLHPDYGVCDVMIRIGANSFYVGKGYHCEEYQPKEADHGSN